MDVNWVVYPVCMCIDCVSSQVTWNCRVLVRVGALEAGKRLPRLQWSTCQSNIQGTSGWQFSMNLRRPIMELGSTWGLHAKSGSAIDRLPLSLVWVLACNLLEPQGNKGIQTGYSATAPDSRPFFNLPTYATTNGGKKDVKLFAGPGTCTNADPGVKPSWQARWF